MKKVKLDEYDGVDIIIISPNQKVIVLIVYILLVFVFAFLSIGCIYIILFTDRAVFMGAVILVSSLIFSYALLKRICSKENVILEQGKITIEHVFIRSRFKSYELSNIRNIRIENEEFAAHDLNRKPFDYHGIGTEQRNINNIISSGRIAFDYGVTTVRIGSDLYFEDADIVLLKLKEHLSSNR